MISDSLNIQLSSIPHRAAHEKVINALLVELNKSTGDYVLKGGTALMECYGLNRFSEDIDLDSNNHEFITGFIDAFCKNNGYVYRVAKDTATVKRFMIPYSAEQEDRLLKVEISYRRGAIDSSLYHKVNGINVYNIDTLCVLKTNAYAQRDKLRDLYDVTYIINNYIDQLSASTIENTRNAVFQKGIEQFDYLTASQSDELINNDTLAENFLMMYERLGLEQESNETSMASQVRIMEDVWNEYFSRPSNQRNGIFYEGEKMRPAVFEDMYLALCKKVGTEPSDKIATHFWKNCVEMQEYEPVYVSCQQGIDGDVQ